MKRPKECRTPDSVWFESEGMARNNAERKYSEGLGFWRVWRCYDHWHVSPMQKWMVSP